VAIIGAPFHVTGPQKHTRASHLVKLSVRVERRNKRAANGHYEPKPNQA